MVYEKIKISEIQYVVTLYDRDTDKVYMTTITASNEVQLKKQIKELEWVGRMMTFNESYTDLKIIKI